MKPVENIGSKRIRLPEEFLLRVKLSNDIVDEMSGYTNLKNAGRDFVCLCPFHSEKTPSCHVYTESQSFYCFGCQTGGDVITFTQLSRNLDYVSAVTFLAERSGIPMPDEAGGSEALEKRRRIYEMHELSAKFFQNILFSDKGKAGIDYLKSRGLERDTVLKYRLGYAPDSWTSLKSFLGSNGYSEIEMVEASLLRAKESRTYDMFRDRAMFPIIDKTGRVIAFSGRRIDGEKDYKYVNSGDTEIYKKGDNIFSLNFAKNAKAKQFILCEGNLDVVSLNQAGFENAVAALGTALTPAQARLIRFYCEEVVIAYDSDGAGEKATFKTINILGREGVSTKILRFEGLGWTGGDPDDYIKLYGAAGFKKLVDNAVSAISFELDKIKAELNLSLSEDRAKYLKKGVQLLAKIENPIERMVYISDLSRDCDVPVVNVQSAIDNIAKSNQRGEERRGVKNLVQGSILREGGIIESGNAKTASFAHKQLTPKEKAERGVNAFLIHSPDKLGKIMRNLVPESFGDEFNRKLFKALTLRLIKGETIDTSSLGGEFSAQEMGKIESIKLENSLVPYDEKRLNDYILTINAKDKLKPSDAYETNEKALEYISSLKGKKMLDRS